MPLSPCLKTPHCSRLSPLSSKRLKRLDNARVQRPPSLLQQTAVGHLMSESMLEQKLTLGEQPGFIEELSGLQVGEATVQGCLRYIGNSMQQR